MNIKKYVSFLLFSAPLLFLGIFYFYPLVKIGLLSFFPGGELQTDQIFKLFHSPIYGNIVWFTVWQALLSTLFTLLLALPGAYLFSTFNFRGKSLLEALMMIPFVMPTVVTAAAFRALLGKHGLINECASSLFGIEQLVNIEQTILFFLLAHIFYNYSLVVKILSSYWSGLNDSLKDAALMLGASPWKTFWKITLPLLFPAILSAALLVFIFCFTSFGVILILGGPAHATIEVEIYRQAVQLFNLPMAATLSCIQLILNFFLMWLNGYLGKKSRVSFFSNDTISTGKKAESIPEKIFICATLIFIFILLIMPLTALLFSSITGENGLTLIYYKALFNSDSSSLFFVKPAIAVKNSAFFGIVSMMLALFLGLSAANFLARDGRTSSLWDAVIMLPLATSAVTLGFGYIITLNKPPLNLRDSIALIPLAHTLIAFPFVVRCILPSLRLIPNNLGEAATLLGASPLKAYTKITLPLIRNSLFVASIFAFAISMGEFGASSFIARPHTPTMPVAIFRFLSQPGGMNYGQAMAMSSILMIVTCSSFWILRKLEQPRSKQE